MPWFARILKHSKNESKVLAFLSFLSFFGTYDSSHGTIQKIDANKLWIWPFLTCGANVMWPDHEIAWEIRLVVGSIQLDDKKHCVN